MLSGRIVSNGPVGLVAVIALKRESENVLCVVMWLKKKKKAACAALVLWKVIQNEKSKYWSACPNIMWTGL